jgi:hypothetical protein
MQDTVREDDIDCRAKTLDDLDFEDRTLQFREIHEFLRHSLLSELDEEHEHIRNTLSSMGTGRYNGDISREIFVFVVQN